MALDTIKKIGSSIGTLIAASSGVGGVGGNRYRDHRGRYTTRKKAINAGLIGGGIRIATAAVAVGSAIFTARQRAKRSL